MQLFCEMMDRQNMQQLNLNKTMPVFRIDL